LPHQPHIQRESGFAIVLNGARKEIADASPNTTLLDWLRSRHLTGAKEGCAEGDCGACTVVVVDRTPEGKRCFRSVNSCIALLPTLADKEIWTVEGIRALGGAHHPVQEAMAANFGSQCGYCTPGFIASLFEGHYREDIATLDDLNDHLCGNLCRCTGYRPIRDAALAAWRGGCPGKKTDPFAQRLDSASTGDNPSTYSRGNESFFQPGSLEEFFRLKKEHPAATCVAGGTEVGVGVAKMFQRHETYIGLQRIRELLEIRREADALLIGGGVTLTDAMPALREDFPSLYEMCRWFASRPIRNRATLGGNLATASPIGDTAPVLLALGASLILASPDSEREIALEDFFTGYRKTVLHESEIIRWVRIPFPPQGVRRLERSVKVSKRREMDISIVSAGICIDLAPDGKVLSVRLGFGGVGPAPMLARRAMQALRGKTWGPEAAEEAARILGGEFEPITDGRGTSEYRSRVPAEIFRAFAKSPEAVSQPLPLNDYRPAPCLDCPQHESGLKHTDGSALYVDDEAERAGAMCVWPVVSPHAHARIQKIEASKAKAAPGILAVLLASDIPGLNNTGPSRHDETLLADGVVEFEGHTVAAIVGETAEACRAAAKLLEIQYEPLEPITSIPQAIAGNSFHTDFNTIARGDADKALQAAPHRFQGEFAFGGQEHFYLETQAAWTEWTEDDQLLVHSSTQHPSEIQTIVAEVLGRDKNRVVVHSPRMGGGFGGKETQGNAPAALAALATLKTGRPCSLRLNRDQDIMMTGKRHPFLARFEAGFDTSGKILALRAELFSNGGWSLDLSLPICDRALFHLDNVYYIPNAHFSGRVCKTNLPSNTAFRGFGGPQGMLIIEEIMDRAARRLGFDPHAVRETNLYHGSGETNSTHYGQEIGDNRIQKIWHGLKQQARFEERQKEIARFNAASPVLRRGIAQTAVKFGISFTFTPYNQAGAMVLVYTDGSVQVNHGGTEMGQGLYTKILSVAARELGIPRDRIRITQTRTDKIPNTSATAASSGSDLNGAATANACAQIRKNLAPVAADLIAASAGTRPEEAALVFSQGKISDAKNPAASVEFQAAVREAYLRRVPLAAYGYYKTPEIHYDRAKGRGRPFYYFACGSAVSEVEVDTSTGQTRLLRVDILHDVGESLHPGIDRGQIEGGFIQGFGWLTSEEVVWNEKGHLLSHGASTYQIPTIGDAPAEFHVAFLENATQPGTIHGSKAVGEPPLMLAISAREAIRNAIAAAAPRPGEIPLASPATCEAVFRAIHAMPLPADAAKRQTY
jgi:xanthine dehydrogenase molybdopterin binding subunit/xanthine dehydrogenase small subunit